MGTHPALQSAPTDPPEGPALVPSGRRFALPLPSEDTALWAFVVLTWAVYLYAYARTPVFAADTDLWYHLNSGRYFWEHGRPPASNFFSFLRPERAWTDYFWLFQALVYRLYSAGGYLALVVFRLATFFAILTAVTLLLVGGRKESRTPALWPMTLLFLVGLVLSTRYFLIRPHTLSYLLLAVSLLILERGRRWAWLLPPLAVLWVNVHGITYPVIFIVCLSYLGDLAWSRVRSGALEPADLRLASLLTLSLLAVYVTPHGTDLLRVPFVSTRYATQYINELNPVQWRAFLSGELTRLVPSSRTAFHLVFFATVACAVLGAFARKLRPRHLLLVFGGAFLLTKGTRMTCEFTLLALPLLALGPGEGRRWARASGRRTAGLVLLLLLGAAQVSMAQGLGWAYWKFPFSPKNLPVGIARFLEAKAPGGRLLNDHNSAGYLQWVLHPRYTIFMDMEVPYLFTDEDMFLTVNVFKNADVFRDLTRTYTPDFVSVPIGNSDFPKIVEKFPAYQPVFFDDAQVLYVDSTRHPSLAAAYALREVRPFELAGEKLEDLLKKWDEATVLLELRRLCSIYADCALANQVLGLLALKNKDFQSAGWYADRVVGSFPEAPQGYKIRGDALQGLRKFREALEQYELALPRAEAGLALKIYREVGQCYRALGEYERAYRAFSRGVPVYGFETTFKELYYLGSAAYLTGRISEAHTLYRFARAKVPASETEWSKRLDMHLALIDAGGARPEQSGSPP